MREAGSTAKTLSLNPHRQTSDLTPTPTKISRPPPTANHQLRAFHTTPPQNARDELERKLREAEAAGSSLKEQLQNKGREKELLEEAERKLRELLEELERKLAEALREKEELGRRLEEAERRLAGLGREKEDTERKLEEAERKIAALTAERDAVKEQLEEAERKLRALASDKGEVERKLEEAERKLREALARVSELEGRVRDQAAEVSDALIHSVSWRGVIGRLHALSRAGALLCSGDMERQRQRTVFNQTPILLLPHSAHALPSDL